MFMDIDEFIKIVGANSELRDACINYPSVYIKLERSRYIKTKEEAEILLDKIIQSCHGVSPSNAWDRWINYIDKFHPQPIIVDHPKKIDTQNHPIKNFSKEIAECIVGLLTIVAKQQDEIISLKEKFKSLDLLHVQSHLGNQASTHLTNALHNTLDRLDQSRHQMASVEVGTVVHKGRISVENKYNVEEEANSSRQDKEISSNQVDVNIEISGLMKLLAESKIGVDVNLNKIQEQIDSTSKKRKKSKSATLEGEYTVSYEGVKIVIGK